MSETPATATSLDKVMRHAAVIDDVSRTARLHRQAAISSVGSVRLDAMRMGLIESHNRPTTLVHADLTAYRRAADLIATSARPGLSAALAAVTDTLEAQRADAPVVSPIQLPARPRLVEPHPMLREIPQDQAFRIGGELAMRRRRRVRAFLSDALLHDALAELVAIEERLQREDPIATKHAADSTRRLLTAVADHVFPARTDPVDDRDGRTRKVGPEEVVNRLMAHIDRWRGLSAEEQDALGRQLHLLWRSVSTDVHRPGERREGKHDYVELLRVLVVVAEAAA